MRNLPILIVTVLLVPGLWLSPGGSISTAASPPLLAVTAPVEGAMVGGTSLTVSFAATNFQIVPSTVPMAEAGKHPELNRPGEGHVHLMLDLQPLVVWTHSDPYTFNDVPPGDHQLTVELANNDHSSLSPPVLRVIHFKTTGPLTLVRACRPGQSDGLLGLLALGGLLLTAGWAVRRQGAGAAGRN